MKRHLLVHSVHFTTEPVMAETEDGLKVEGRLPVAVIELVCPKGVGTTVTHRERVPSTEDVARVKACFPVGGTVEMELRAS
jgi:hypothetical protein